MDPANRLRTHHVDVAERPRHSGHDAGALPAARLHVVLCALPRQPRVVHPRHLGMDEFINQFSIPPVFHSI